MTHTIQTGLGEVEYVTVTITADVDIHTDVVQLAVGTYTTVLAVGTHPTWLTPDLLTFSVDGKTATAKLLIGNGHVNPVAGTYRMWWRVVDGVQTKIEPVKSTAFVVTDTAGSTVAGVPPWTPLPSGQTPGKVATVAADGNSVEWDTPSGGGSFPDFTGSGSPEGVITADVGKFYVDTAQGGLYAKNTGSGNTGWMQAGGGMDDAGVNTPGVSQWAGDQIVLIAKQGSRIQLTDQQGWDNSGNGLYFNSGAADGDQRVEVLLGPGSAHSTKFNADGSTEFPGDVTMPAGKGPVIHDDADGHTYRIGSHNGAVTLTLVT